MFNQFPTRPRSLGEILDAAVRIYRNNFWTLLGIVAVIQLPIVLFSMFVLTATFQNLFATLQNPTVFTPSTTSLPLSLASNLNTLLSAVFMQFANAALAIAVISLIFGRKITFRDAYRYASKRWKSITGLIFLATVTSISLGIFTLLLIFTVVGWVAGFGALMFFSMAVAPLITTVLIGEDASAWAVIRRTWQLVRDHPWRAICFSILINALMWIIQIGPTALFGGVLAMILADGSLSDSLATTIGVATGAIGTLLAAMLVLPFRLIAFVLFYLDLRVRDEGLDLLIKSSDEQTISADPIHFLANAPQAPSTGKTIRRSDIKRSFGLGFLFFVVIFGVVGLFTGAIAGLAALLAF